MLYEITDGSRSVKVLGQLLAKSSSESGYKDRWVEFQLFKTENSETYVVHRAGMSRIFHSESCPVVSRNHLTPRVALEDLDPGVYSPCNKCKPNWGDPEGIYPENPRYHVQVCHSPEGVIRYLTKYDDDNSEYLTNVARVLLESASLVDTGIKNAYMGEVID